MAVAISYRERYPFGTEAYNKADEHWHQVCFCEFVRKEYAEHYETLFAIPNGGTRNRVEAANMKMEGVKAGVTDLQLAYPMAIPPQGFTMRYRLFCGLFLEMKRPEGSYGVSDKQVEFMAAMRRRGYATGVAHGWYAAVGLFLYYIGAIGRADAHNVYGVNVDPESFGEGLQEGIDIF